MNLQKGLSHSPGPTLMSLWDRFRKMPAGQWMFTKLVGVLVPYTGSISPEIRELGGGKAKVELQDRRKVRNHLGSIHAVALMNLGEASTGLALLSALPEGVRAILKGLSIQYLKKARGTIRGEATVDRASFDSIRNLAKAPDQSADVKIQGELKNDQGETVSTVEALWRISLGK